MRVRGRLLTYSAEDFEPDAVALLDARARGCVCNPEIIVKGHIARVRHDSWCPLNPTTERSVRSVRSNRCDLAVETANSGKMVRT